MNFISRLNKDCENIAPVALTIINAVGIIGTAIFTVKGTVKALELIKEAEEEKGEELTTAEKVKVAYKPYIPAAAIGAVSIASGVGAQILNNKQKIALAGAALTLDKMYKEYKGSVKDIYGDEGDKKVEENIVKSKSEHIDFATDPDPEIEMFYDPWYGDYFPAKKEDIINAWYQANLKLVKHDYVSLADLHKLYGLTPKPGEEKLGWSWDTFAEGWNEPAGIDFYFNEVILDDGMKVNDICMLQGPEPDFDIYYN